MLGSAKSGQLLAQFVGVEFAVLELLAAQFVVGKFALTAVLAAALLQG